MSLTGTDTKQVTEDQGELRKYSTLQFSRELLRFTKEWRQNSYTKNSLFSLLVESLTSSSHQHINVLMESRVITGALAGLLGHSVQQAPVRWEAGLPAHGPL
jgi:hypothetical protein